LVPACWAGSDQAVPKTCGALSDREPGTVATVLLNWMEASRRALPWRERRDPYSVWVSEIMLQQTRVETAAPYFERWMLRFPDIRSLAASTQEEVLKAWEGLGYYSRARNLHSAAQQVVAQFEGRLPRDRRLLMALPGIGPYTAGAILSLAFGLPQPALDGNTRRVLCRLYNVEEEASKASTQGLLWRLATQLVTQAPAGRAGDLNESLIELGALVCRPGRPECGICPLVRMCVAYSLGVQSERPVVAKRRAPPHFPAVAGVIWDADGRLLLSQRHPTGLLGGMWGFPGSTVTELDALADSLKYALMEMVGIDVAVREVLLSFRHAYTHFSITLHAFRCELLAGIPRPIKCAQVVWAAPGELERYPFPVTDRKVLRFLEETSPPHDTRPLRESRSSDSAAM
jgi:A/G-specific adenine glycosylase